VLFKTTILNQSMYKLYIKTLKNQTNLWKWASDDDPFKDMQFHSQPFLLLY